MRTQSLVGDPDFVAGLAIISSFPQMPFISFNTYTHIYMYAHGYVSDKRKSLRFHGVYLPAIGEELRRSVKDPSTASRCLFLRRKIPILPAVSDSVNDEAIGWFEDP